LKLLYLLYRFYAGLLGILSERMMFLASSKVAFLLYYMVRYRKRVIRKNLTSSFPDKSQHDIRWIHRRFIQNFSDIFHEMIWLRKMGKEELLLRVNYINPELVQDLTSSGRSVMIVSGHAGNWELLGLTLPLVTGCKTYGAAKKQSSDRFNSVINSLRSRMGLEILQSDNLYRALMKQPYHPFTAFLIADQSPVKQDIECFVPFLNRQTPVFTGPERIARAMNLVVVFAGMHRITRGYYSVEFQIVDKNPKLTEPFEITRRHNSMLEALILKYPDGWLWSHRKWKHSPDESVQ
jgi:Kdo2-lipid IVA lauroyltransferase/acyltransferase